MLRTSGDPPTHNFARQPRDAQWAVRRLSTTDIRCSPYLEAVERLAARAPVVHYRQTPAWASLVSDQANYLFVLTMVGEEAVASSLLRRRSLPVMPKAKYFVTRGPIFQDAEALSRHLIHLSETCADGIWVRVQPHAYGRVAGQTAAVLKLHGYAERKEGSSLYDTTVVVDLEQSVDQIWSSFRPQLRRQLRKADRLGLEVRPKEGEESLRHFVAGMQEVAQHKGRRGLSTELASGAYYSALGPGGRGKVLLARWRGSVVAGIWLFPNRERVIYEWGFSSPLAQHRRIPLSHLLHWVGIKWAKAQGYKYYDFGGYWQERGDRDPINRFKTGFSQYREPLGPEYEKVISPLSARVLRFLGQGRIGLERWARLHRSGRSL